MVSIGFRGVPQGHVRDAGLVVERVAFFIEVAVLEHGNPLAQGALELKHTWKLLIETFSLFHALDVGPKRFSQIDCGEHLHDSTYDVPTVPGDVTVSVGDIRHPGFQAGTVRSPHIRIEGQVLGLLAVGLRSLNHEGVDGAGDALL
jgi:hypothetical protein